MSAALSSRAYGSRSTKPGSRRTKAEIAELCEELYEIVREFKPMTVRQIFYQAVSRGLIEKSEAEYKGTIIRLLTRMRKTGEMPFSWIADETRWVRRPTTFSSLEDALRITAETYRRSLWADTATRVEIWLEKEALAGVLYDVTHEWDVPLYVTRGYASLTYLYGAAEAIRESDKPTWIYYFGDYDPSGMDIFRNIVETMDDRLESFPLWIERVAVTEEQIEDWDLPTRPTKRTDTRSKGFDGESVEVDAIHPDRLRLIAQQNIREHLDTHQVEQLEAIEDAERVTLQSMALGLADAGEAGQ